MARTEKVTYTCDKCGEITSRDTKHKLSLEWSANNLFNPMTWGDLYRKDFDLCEVCYDKFLKWLRSNNAD